MSELTDGIRKEIIQAAESWKGTTYQYGGTSKKGIDCSHFVYEVFKAAVDPNINYASTSYLLTSGDFVDVDKEFKVGDLVFWPGHVGVVIDVSKGQFIGAQSRGVGVDSYVTGYWAGQYGGKKPLKFRRHKKLMSN